MKAFFIKRYGKKEQGQIGDLPEPVVRDNDVLVQVHAASVNLLDSKIRSGEFKLILPYKMPLILGNDLAGTVMRIGSKVRQFKVGDQVYARAPQARIGSFAELIAMDQSAVAKMPTNVSMEEAASLPLVALTAWQVLVERAELKRGQKVLIHAGSGGVGTIAIQLAKHLGATVATTASAANADFLKSLGADIVVDYKNADFSTLLHDYDVVLNSLGSDVLKKSLKVLKPGGKLISISGPPDPSFASEEGLNFFLKMVMTLLSFGIRKKAKQRNISYSFLFMKADGAQLGKITSLVEAGVIRPIVERVFPFSATSEALALVEKGRSRGKIVIRMI